MEPSVLMLAYCMQTTVLEKISWWLTKLRIAVLRYYKESYVYDLVIVSRFSCIRELCEDRIK